VLTASTISVARSTQVGVVFDRHIHQQENAMETLPITCRFANPWIEDNSVFVKTLGEIGSTVTSARTALRERMEDSILKAEPAEHHELAAVDSSNITVEIADFSTVLAQAAIHYRGETTFGQTMRFGPMDSESARSFYISARIAAECELLAGATTPVIADNSLWSFLMEANQAITSWGNSEKRDDLTSVINLIESLFLPMLQNKNLLAMPKSGTSSSISNHPDYKDLFTTRVSDKFVLSQVLEPGEYTRPKLLGVLGHFGIERRAEWDVDAINAMYTRELYYTYYKPWPYKSCYRIEGRKCALSDATFASVKEATRHRTIAEPLPQFMVDVAVKQLVGISELYGDSNSHRIPFTGFNRTFRR